MSKKVLVTGHTGFKGGWLSQWLLSLGAEVFGIALPPEGEVSLFKSNDPANFTDGGQCRDFLYVKDAAAMHFKAVAHLKDGKKAQTLYIMKEYLKGHERDPRAGYLKGRLTLAAGEVDEAERDFKKVVSLNPDYCNGYLGLALVALIKERKDEGIRLLERAIEINPGYSEAFLLLVTVYAQAGDTEKALETAKKAKEINPYDLDVLINLGTAYTRKGDLRNGALLYLEASRLYPENPVVQYNLGYIFYISGQKEEAKTWLRRAVMVDPEFEPAIELLRKIQ